LDEFSSLLKYAIADVMDVKVTTAADRQYSNVAARMREIREREMQETTVMLEMMDRALVAECLLCGGFGIQLVTEQGLANDWAY
jgi:hypothetical protein